MSEYGNEILELISEEYPQYSDSRLSEFKQILGGADTTIYGFDVILESESLPLILRVYRPHSSGSGMKEFRVIQELYARGVGVPRPYVYTAESGVNGRAHLIMERIDGLLFADELYASRFTSRFNELLEMFVRNLVAIHSVDWTEGLTFLDRFDIAENPHLFITNELAAPKRIINEHRMGDLLPVIDWIESNEVSLGIPVLLHADYHGMNNLLKGPDTLVTIDWANARLGDCRFDLAFAVTFLSSMGLDVRARVVAQYESFSGKKIRNLQYFMVLASLWNLLRIYSAVCDHRIMNESKETASLLRNQYRDYALEVVRTTQDITGVSLKEIVTALE
jgi:aminoglycoside phosphotransferase (APT) family kinase protein